MSTHSFNHGIGKQSTAASFAASVFRSVIAGCVLFDKLTGSVTAERDIFHLIDFQCERTELKHEQQQNKAVHIFADIRY